MIKTEFAIHDNFSVEFKTGFITYNKTKDINDFKINTWIFVPNGLDINSSTYPKEQFYKDVKKNIRLITPIYSLSEILEEGRGPFIRLQKAIDALIIEPNNEEKLEHFSYQIKMLLSIVKSALRRDFVILRGTKDEKELLHLIQEYVNNIKTLIKKYRGNWSVLANENITEQHRYYFTFGDNFLGNITEQHLFLIIDLLKNKPIYVSVKELLTGLIADETEYRKEAGYLVLEKNNESHNSIVISQRNILKKYIESDLFLRIVRKKDGAIAEQVYYSLAAGLAMVVATVISYISAARYGNNYTSGVFILVIVGYMLKDRVKDLARYYFLSSMSKKYFDAKLKLSIRNQEIGWVKESFDFVGENKVPEDIMALRYRSPLIEAENKIYNEQIILYRKWVNLSKNDLEKYKEYRLSGVNDITRFNLQSFLQKMDNPYIPLEMLNEKYEVDKFEGSRVYSLHFILECQSDSEEYYRTYRIFFNRNGITNITEM